MSVDIIIDSREEKLIQVLECKDKEYEHMMFEVEQLDVGDVIFKHEGQVICIIERKTIEDYAQSIVDKRLKNQAIRISELKKGFPKMIVIYLVEGHFLQKNHKFRNGVTRDAMYSSMINRIVKDNFTIFHSSDINDTASVVTKIYDKLNEIYTNTVIVSDDPDDQKLSYLKTIKISKKDNMTPENCFVCQLAQIPGISIETANKIAKIYPSMNQLLISYQQYDSRKEKMLSGIPISTSRKLGPVLSKRIYQYLYGINESTTEEQLLPKKIKITIKKFD